MNGYAPSYIKDLLVPYTSARESRRSQNKHRLIMPKVKATFGERAFSYASPRLWNALPLDIKTKDSVASFKTALKTHLFGNPDFPPPLLV